MSQVQAFLPRSRQRRVTLGDVAARAGVSLATASVAMTGKSNGSVRVSKTVASRIRRAARDLDYRPNIQARSLSMQRTQTIAMLVKKSTWHNAMFFLGAAQRVLRSRGFTEIFLLHQDDELPSEREHLEMCLERRVEGILIMPLIDLAGRTNCRLMNRMHRRENIPLVQLGIAIEGCVSPSVVTDEVGGVYHTVRKLHEMGHRRIAHVTLRGYDDPNPFNPYRHAHLRYAGYRRAMEELNLAPRVLCPAMTETRVEAEFEEAVRLAHEIAAMARPPTAVICYSDYESAGLLAGFAEAGVKVPDQISLVGFGDQQFARMARPALATMMPAYEQMGRMATETLIQMIEGAPGESASVMPALALRQSIQFFTR